MTSFGGDWRVLDLEEDPVHGDPSQVQTAAKVMEQETETWSQHAQDLNGANEYGQSMPMDGDFAQPFRSSLEEHPQAAQKLVGSHQQAGTALSQYAGVLDEAKSASQSALAQGIQAKESYDQAMRVYNETIAEMEAFPKVWPPEQLPWAQEQWAMMQRQADQAQEYAEQAEMSRQEARQQAVVAGEQAQAAEENCAVLVQDAAPRLPGVRRNSNVVNGLAVQPTDGRGSGWRSGDPIPQALTGDHIPFSRDRRDIYEGEQYGTSERFRNQVHKVEYMSDARREAHRVFVDGNGKLRWAKDGSLFDTSNAATLHSEDPKAIFVMDRSGNMYASLEQRVGYLHHSSFLSGGPIAGGGEIAVRDGRLVEMTNQSGHYWPTAINNHAVVTELRRQGIVVDPNFEFTIEGTAR